MKFNFSDEDQKPACKLGSERLFKGFLMKGFCISFLGLNIHGILAEFKRANES
jgi:hypothetical protein